MKVGIITFHRADNYGAVLQAYALIETLRSHGYITEIIDYAPSSLTDQYNIFNFNVSGGTAKLKELLRGSIRLCLNFPKKHRKFEAFRKMYLPISVSYTNAGDIAGYDAYIAGSDQIWNGVTTDSDPAFFLSFRTCDSKTISYAASIGLDVLSEGQRAYVRDNLHYIDYISVRELSAVELIQSMTDRPVTQVLDPTLLADASIYRQLIGERLIKQPYIFVYKMTYNPLTLKTALAISKQTGLKVVVLPVYERIGHDIGEHCLFGQGPLDFLTLLYHASFVVTDSFHGLAFSVVFHKNFLTTLHPQRSGRIRSLLSLLDLDSRRIENAAQLTQNLPFTVDYSKSDLILQKEKERSLSFLLSALEEANP